MTFRFFAALLAAAKSPWSFADSRWFADKGPDNMSALNTSEKVRHFMLVFRQTGCQTQVLENQKGAVAMVTTWPERLNFGRQNGRFDLVLTMILIQLIKYVGTEVSNRITERQRRLIF